ncbi:hypothetical protein LCGC14_1449310 [marine sediment metagenome]|uniref:Uncharacterized protein n=1 Tax=marine sediment metagenome TaxID=412755 RepID=A0A0F9K4K8_9ZZZZ
MKDYQIALCCVGLYCAMVAFTHGYVMDRNDCYINPPEYGSACSEEPMAKATIWPVYWIYHSGTLLFEPINTD